MIIEIGTGEALDRLSILNIKLDKIENIEKRKNIIKEYESLMAAIVSKYGGDILNEDINDNYKQLSYVNGRLWDIEDKIREKEKESEFDDEFITLARQVYFLNDDRAILKKRINIKYNSEFIEEKSYSDYR
jgi:hypothetical protein